MNGTIHIYIVNQGGSVSYRVSLRPKNGAAISRDRMRMAEAAACLEELGVSREVVSHSLEAPPADGGVKNVHLGGCEVGPDALARAGLR